MRAVVEGIALGFADCLAVAREAGTRVSEAVAANGAGRSPMLRQALADAMGIPVTWSNDGGATVRGAAILAGLGVGALDAESLQTATGRGWWASGTVVRHEPNPDAHVRLLGVAERRRALYAAEVAARARGTR